MSKRSIGMLAAGLVAGATLVGVPTFAFAESDTSTSTSGSDMSTVMNDPAFIGRMKEVMSEMMSDEKLQEQMRSMMGDMGGMSEGDMGDMGDMGDGQGQGQGGTDGSSGN